MKREKKASYDKRALTPEGVSEVYQIPKGTLANLRSQKRGPRYYKVGRRVLYFIEDAGQS